MKEIPVIYSEKSFLHKPDFESVLGQRLPYLETPQRVEVILKALRACGFADINVTTVKGMPWIEQVHDSKYLQFLRDTSENFDQLAREAKVNPEEIKAFYPTVILPDDFDEKAEFYQTLEARLGIYSDDPFAPITRETFQAATGSAAIAVAGAQLLLSGERFVYSLCRPPGHHASKREMGGYCYINNTAVAVEVLISGGAKRVAILDIDFHHCNGTQDIFYRDGRVVLVSLHGSPATTYPYKSGFSWETGEGEGKGKILNIPLEEGIGEEVYQAALDYGLGEIETFRPDFLVVSAGFDTHKDDPFSSFRLSTGYYQIIGKTIANLNLPVLMVQEGGYEPKILGESVVSYLRGLIGI